MKKYIAHFVLYNVISLFVTCASVVIMDSDAYSFSDLIAGAYIGVFLLLALLYSGCWAIGAINE